MQTSRWEYPSNTCNTEEDQSLNLVEDNFATRGWYGKYIASHSQVAITVNSFMGTGLRCTGGLMLGQPQSAEMGPGRESNGRHTHVPEQPCCECNDPSAPGLSELSPSR